MINKCDSVNMDVRARLVAKQFKRPGVDSIFAPTPPLAAFRLLCSSAVARRRDRGVRKLYILGTKGVLPRSHQEARVREASAPEGH